MHSPIFSACTPSRRNNISTRGRFQYRTATKTPSSFMVNCCVLLPLPTSLPSTLTTPSLPNPFTLQLSRHLQLIVGCQVLLQHASLQWDWPKGKACTCHEKSGRQLPYFRPPRESSLWPHLEPWMVNPLPCHPPSLLLVPR